MHRDQIYIQYLQETNNQGIELIYNQYAKKIVTLIQQNSGSEDDGYDIFQESLVDIYHLSLRGDFVLTTSFESFLKLVCKRKWLNVLKKNKQLEVTKNEDHLLIIEDSSQKEYEEMLFVVERENKVMELLDTLGQSCQNIIKRCMKEKHQEQIAESLGISYAYLRKKKSECMAQLVAKVKALNLF